MIGAVFEYAFMRNALLAALLASITVGIIGTVAIEKKLVSMSGGLAHAAFGGIGLGYLAGFEPIWGGITFAVAASALVFKTTKNARLKADAMTVYFGRSAWRWAYCSSRWHPDICPI